MLAKAAVNAAIGLTSATSAFTFRFSFLRAHQAPSAKNNRRPEYDAGIRPIRSHLHAALRVSEERKNVTPAERKLFMKYRNTGARRAASGGLFGALAMAGVWKIAALGTAFGVTGVIVGSLFGAWMAMCASRIRLKMVKEMVKLPTDESPQAAEAREILRTKLRENPYAQKLLKKAEFASDGKKEKTAPESSKDK